MLKPEHLSLLNPSVPDCPPPHNLYEHSIRAYCPSGITYNEQWWVERHGFRSLALVRRDLLTTQEMA